MDPVQKESAESLEPETLIVPPEIVKAFGRGLKQITSLQIQEINSAINNLEINPGKSNKQHITTIKSHIERITNILNGFEKAKDVKVLCFEGGNEFRFSEEIEEAEPRPGEIIMGESITPKFVNALSHTIRNPLAVLLGRAEDIPGKEGTEIAGASKQIAGTINSFNNAHNIIMITDTQGSTTIQIR